MRWVKFYNKVEGKEVDYGDLDLAPTPGHALPIIGSIIRNFLWRDVETIDLKADVAKTGFRVGYIVGGQAFLAAKVLTSPKIGLIIGRQKYKIFAIDLQGREIDFVFGRGRIDFNNTWLHDYYVF